MATVMTLTLTTLRQMDPDYLLLPAEVASIFRVDPKTVTRWAAAGKIQAIRTDGGHRRFRVAVVLAKLEEGAQEAEYEWAEDEL